MKTCYYKLLHGNNSKHIQMYSSTLSGSSSGRISYLIPGKIQCWTDSKNTIRYIPIKCFICSLKVIGSRICAI